MGGLPPTNNSPARGASGWYPLQMLTLLLACDVGVPLGRPDAPERVDHEVATADWTVDCAGGADFETIGDAIDAASSEQVIDVAPCTYSENINFGGKSLTIRGTSGSSETILQASTGAVVTATTGEGEGTAIIGFTLTGGNYTYGSAVYMDFSALRLEDVLITDNQGSYVIYSASGDLELEGVTFAGNSLRGGMLIYASKGAVLANNSSFECDNGSYGAYFSHGSAYVDRASFTCDGTYATYWEHAVGRLRRSDLTGSVVVVSEDDHYDDVVTIENSIIHGGVGSTYGSLALVNSVMDGQLTASSTYTSTRIEGNVFTGSTCAISSDLVVIRDSADTSIIYPVDPFTVRNNLFWDVARPNCDGDTYVGVDGNIEGDPLFTDYAGGDLHLGAGSPAIDAGPEDDGYDDVDGSRNDIGVYGGRSSLDGGW